ncbi:alpha/beta hydrolase [Galbibacter pacificus]|uniref:Alpha/beta hydrolase n=1 Tax=Galbibacter pacificus TaxID=2996052 RepID=A0ABT6FU60_9FLAO|nr:alpha/beta hydrolase [Galbibacter pacificus]MDG3583316.1 alpha/beta hydrolase [Galbibacter pacificus]MDG3586797.1 alpha/beta hydrolase [Galbibacter pacificus]
MKKAILILFLAVAPFCIAQENPIHSFSEKKDILWASPKGFDLTMDIYTPTTNKDSYPVLIIYHGGGWLINNKSIMDEMSKYLASHANYVICNVNYRLLTANNNTTNMNEIIEDAMGAVLWVKENIEAYKGNPNAIAITGDSAGGHLAAMVINGSDYLNASGFKGNSLGFNPTYIPKGENIETIKKNNALQVQAAVLSYPAVDIYAAAYGDGKNGFESPSNFFWEMGGAKARGIFGENTNVKENPDYYKKVSPIYTVPNANDRKLPPQFCHVGSKDNTTSPVSIKAYVDKLKEEGQPVDYWVYEGRNHAYLDSGTNEFLGNSFEKDAIEPLKKIISFLDNVFYKE